MNVRAYIPSWITNKFSLCLVCFVSWMLFFDDRDLPTTYFKQRNELEALMQSKSYYEKQIAETRQELDRLKMSAATIEKYSREKYLMKRDNEDLFVVEDEK